MTLIICLLACMLVQTTTAGIQGFYSDISHADSDGPILGSRMVSDAGPLGDGIVVVGTDDGIDVFTLYGHWVNKTAGAFSLAELDGQLVEDGIALGKNGKWERKPQPGWKKSRPNLAGPIGGIYKDPNHYEDGTYKGSRFISYPSKDKLVVMGSDDGEEFWYVFGTYSFTSGEAMIDFSPKGGPADLKATYSAGKLTFGDGNAWTKYEPMK